MAKKSKRKSKQISVKDVNGNKHILRATVFSVRKDQSQAIIEEESHSLGITDKLVEPPLSQRDLSVLSETSNELNQVLDSMAIGIEGFGHRLVLREMTEAQLKKHKRAINEEKRWLDALFEIPNYRISFPELRKNTRKDLEQVGNAYWELVRSATKRSRFTCINRLDAGTMWIARADRRFTKLESNYVDDNLTLRKKSFKERLRRFVQVSGTKRVYFKEFGDPRIINLKDGIVIAKNEADFKTKSPAFKKDHPKSLWANEVLHHRLYHSRKTPYGMPRFTGNIIAIRGSRGADETNIITQQNNHVPSMAISVAGGQLTEGSVKRIQEFIDTQTRPDSNYSKFLLIEGVTSHDGLSGPSNIKIDIKPLSNNQHKDELWQKYDENNQSKIRRSFRTPPMMVGKTEDMSRANSQESERFAEKYVYNPEREAMDWQINRIIAQQGFRFWVFKSNSPNVTNDEDLVEILKGGERSGGLTPRIARMLLEDVLNRKLPPIKEDDPNFDPDIPFSMSLARLTSGMGTANQAGTLGPQGQIPKSENAAGRKSPKEQTAGKRLDAVDQLYDNLFGNIDIDRIFGEKIKDPHQLIDALTELHLAVEDSLDVAVFGKRERNFFKHEH